MGNVLKLVHDKEPEKPSKKRCLFYWQHDFTLWEETQHGPVVYKGSTIPVGNYVEQKRACNRCGRLEMRKETTA